MKKKKLAALITSALHKAPSKKKVIWTSVLVAVISAVAFAGATLLLSILSVVCALNMGCSSEQDFQLTLGVIAYFAILIASIILIHKSSKVAYKFLLLAWISGIALFFVAGWSWMKVDTLFAQHERRQQIERLKQDYDKVNMGKLNVTVERIAQYNEVSINLSLPINFAGSVATEFISQMFIITKQPQIFDKNNVECKLFENRFHLFKNSTLYTENSKQLINVDNKDRYSLEKWLSLKKTSDSTCSDGALFQNVTSDDFEVTKVPLDELIPDRYK